MNAPLAASDTFQRIALSLREGRTVEAHGCVPVQRLHLLDALSSDYPFRILLTHDDARAKELCEDLRFFDRSALLFPARDLIFYAADVHGNALTAERMKGFRAILEGRPFTLVTTFAELLTPQAPLSALQSHVLTLDKKKPVDENALPKQLAALGYLRTHQVEAPGEFAVRGDIIDIFDLTEDNPYRIELFGDEITSIRSFDVLSQRSVEHLNLVRVYPASELILEEERLHDGFDQIMKEAETLEKELRDAFHTEEAHRLSVRMKELKESALELENTDGLEGFLRYFYEEPAFFADLFPAGKTAVFIDEAAHCYELGCAAYEEFTESMTHRAAGGYALRGQKDLLFSPEESVVHLRDMPVLLLDTLALPKDHVFSPEASFAISAQSVAPYNNSFDGLIRDLKRYRKEHYKVLLLSGSRARAKRLTQDLTDNGVTAFYSEDPDRVLQPDEVMTYYGYISRGFAYPSLKFVVITESDIFSGREKRKKRRKKFETKGERISSFADLKVGDYVVHVDHGLGIYQGIEQIEIDHVVKDYLKVTYRDGGNLFVSVAGLDVLQKYASAESAHKPKLNKLGGSEWTKTKEKVQGAVTEVASDLVALYAARQEAKGFVFSKDTVWQQEFEEAFPYEETADQMSAIEATKEDMESTRIMDRLICGDVGFGKTEVAIRAAFKAVQDGKQAALLVPTTILAQQHFNTFTERMKSFPVKIDLLSRFRTAAEQRRTIEGLKKGSVDIVIGTHRLLSKDVGFKDLGLLIVDEEQRFGVTHKEKIKKIKTEVDVLTLTATPIPRTLHMSLVGIRDMSLLTEPPLDRMPIQTFVSEYDEELVREAILRETARGGQVYYVYNRVNTIAEVAAHIASLVPHVRVAFAHGQMQEAELERIMYEFIAGDIDVLLSTTIIETGLDIPNVNTMIVHDSDQMGLAQLYQLRGRVGRSNRTSYAFLLYKRDKLLREVAEKRLSAIREFTDLGSGYKIAMRDLEIRGAGNLLGKKQSGHMAAVGYDLYCRMLSDAVKRLKNEEPVEENAFTTAVDLDTDAFIPSEYILNEEQKLEVYQRIALIDDASEADDMLTELTDRFGEPPLCVENLIRIALIREKAHRLYLTDVKGGNGSAVLKIRKDAQIASENIPPLVASFAGRLALKMYKEPCFEYSYDAQETDVVTAIEELLERMEGELLGVTV